MKKLVMLGLAIIASASLVGVAHGEISSAQKRQIKQVVPNVNSAIDTIVDASNKFYLTQDIQDLSAEATYYQVVPYAGRITKISTVIDGVVSSADVTLTCNIGATPITNGVVTIATASSAAGDRDSATPTAANTMIAGSALNCVVTGGGAGGSPRGHVIYEVTR